MKNFISSHLVEQTWLNESEVQIILSVLADGLKQKNPELESSIDNLLEIDHKQLPENIQLKNRFYLQV